MKHRVRVARLRVDDLIVGRHGRPTRVLEVQRPFRGLVWVACADGDARARKDSELVTRL